MTFRKDINALRALAVISVVIYHFFPSMLPGGFVGVDIFFVISGYLMTNIIITQYDNHTFSLKSFYIRRAKRIWPALAFLCFCLIILGWFILSPIEYYNLAKHAESSLLFYSNNTYLSESGYFDVSPKEKWLLHTWSLSVEWQFYLLYPLIIKVLFKTLNVKKTVFLLILIFICSFTFSLYSSYFWKEISYFIFPSRAWELIFGGLIYFISNENNKLTKKKLQYLGAALIILSLFFIDSNMAWPGFMALLPVLGSALFIFANRQEGFFSNSGIFKYIGKWSYSIYLWHWPVLALTYYIYTPSNYILLLGMVISLILGCLSFYIIEAKKILYIDMLIVLIPMAMSIILVNLKGFAYQVPKSIYKANFIDPKSEEYGGYTWSRVKQFSDGFSNEKPNMLLIGDSQSGDFANIFYLIGGFDKYELRSTLISAKCGAFYIGDSLRNDFFNVSTDIINGKVSKKLCVRQWDNYYNSSVLSKSDIIFVAMNWRDYSPQYISHSIKKIREKNYKAKIFIVGAKALGSNIPKEMYRSYKERKDVNSIVYIKAHSKNYFNSNKLKENVLQFKNVYYIDMRKFLCNSSTETCMAVINGEPTFYDGPHTTYIGNKYLSTYVKNLLVKNGVL